MAFTLGLRSDIAGAPPRFGKGMFSYIYIFCVCVFVPGAWRLSRAIWSSAASQVRAMAPKSPPALPPRGELARLWENEPTLRQRILSETEPNLTRWLNKQSVCVASTAAMALNARVLEVLAMLWAPLQPSPKPVPVDYLCKEARSGMFWQVSGH